MATAPELLPPPPRMRTLPRLENGEHLDQQTFHARYAAMPKSIKAELIGGRVYLMASPLHPLHGQHHSRLMGWLEVYLASTPGTNVFDNTSAILGNDYACGVGGGPPRKDHVAQAGQIYILDVGPAYRGYFADNARATRGKAVDRTTRLRSPNRSIASSTAASSPGCFRSTWTPISCRASSSSTW